MAVTAIIRGDATQLNAEQKKVAAEAAKVRQEFSSVAKESDKLERAGVKAFNSTRTALEKYNLRAGELRQLLSSGKITLDTYNRSIDQAAVQYEKASKAGEKAFGPGMIRGMSGLITKLTSVTLVIDGIRRTIQSVREEEARLAEGAKERFVSKGQLRQLASDSEDYQSLLKMSQEVLASGAVTSAQEADKLVYDIRSTGLDQQKGTILDVARTGLASDIKGLTKAIDSLTDAYAGQDIGDLPTLISKALTITPSTQAEMDQILSASSIVAQTAKTAGISANEVMSGTAIMTDPLSGDIGIGASRLKGFISATQRQGLTAKTLVGLVEQVEQALKESGETQIEFLGAIEAVEGFEALKGRINEYKDLVKKVEATSTGQKLSEAITDLTTTQKAVIDQRAAEGGLRVQEDLSLEPELASTKKAIWSQAETVRRQLGYSPVGRAVERSVDWMSYFFGAEELIGQDYAKELRAQAAAEGKNELVAALEKLIEYQREAIELQKQIREENSAKRYGTRPVVPAPEG